MRFMVLSRRTIWLCAGVAVMALLLWYGLSGPPAEVPTSGVSIHRIEGEPGLATSPAESPANNPAADTTATRKSAGPAMATTGFAAQYNLERSRQRSARAEVLAKIIDDPATSQTVRDEAQRKLLTDIEVQTKEEELVRLLKAEGFRDPVVVLNDRGLTISLYGVALDGSTATRVGELAARMTGVSREKIVIMERR